MPSPPSTNGNPSSYSYNSRYNYNYYTYEEPNAVSANQNSSVEAPCGWYRSLEAAVVGGASYKEQMGLKADRFPWCSEREHNEARRKYNRYRNLTSVTSGLDRSSVNFAIVCGSNRMFGIPVAPGGVLYNLSPAPGDPENLKGTMTSFTSHWSLTVTTKRTVCPKFSAAFSSALAYATYIEIIITMVLVFVFKMCALIEDQKGVIDLSKGVIRHATLKQVAVSPE